MIYSTLQEVWGGNADGAKTSSDTAPSTPEDPLCELYGRQFAAPKLSLQDMTNDDYFQNNFASYTEPVATGNLSDTTATSVAPVSSGTYHAIDTDDSLGYANAQIRSNNAGADDDDLYISKALDAKPTVASVKPETPAAVAPTGTTSTATEFAYQDLCLYIASGVLLIFMLDRIFAIGMQMRG